MMTSVSWKYFMQLTLINLGLTLHTHPVHDVFLYPPDREKNKVFPEIIAGSNYICISLDRKFHFYAKEKHGKC